MKKLIPYIIAIAITSLLWWWWCHWPKCNSCNDPQLIKVVPGSSQIRYNWEFIQAVQHSNNTATSSISIVPAGTVSINSVANDSVTTSIILVASDSISGIHCLGVKGGFGFTCLNPEGGPGIAIDGIIPFNEDCNALTKCCLRTMQIRAENIGSHIKCTPGKILSGGTVGLTGIIRSCAGSADTVYLSINFH